MFILISSFAVIQLVLRKEVPKYRMRVANRVSSAWSYANLRLHQL